MNNIEGHCPRTGVCNIPLKMAFIPYIRSVKKIVSFIGLWLVAQCSPAQSKFPIRDITVYLNGKELHNAFCGGINSPIISEINLNGDELPDLFVFDKYGNKALPFINQGNIYPKYLYAPQYENAFPNLTGWAVVRDFNYDNVPDIFTLNGNYIRVFRGRKAGNQLQFDTLSNRLMYRINEFNNAIWTFINDLPAFIDVNGDNDLDVLTFDVNGGQTINYYENQSQELGYGADSLLFLAYDFCWGHVAESPDNNSLVFAACKRDGNETMNGSSASRHQGGTLFAFDYEHDGDVDVLLGDVSYNNLTYAQNNGTQFSADITYIDSLFPHYNVPVNLPIFPAAYVIENDLWIAPFNYDGSIGISKDIRNIQHYKNQNDAQFEKYVYAGDTFFVNQIFDAGSDSKAVFDDVDADGKLDIVVGENVQYFDGIITKSKLHLLKNVSDESEVKFKLAENWCNSEVWNFTGIYPTFGDLDGDGLRDLLIGDNAGKLHFLKRESGANPFPAITTSQYFNLAVSSNARPFIYDVNNDRLNDILVGQRTGEVRYYWNFGTSTNAQFHKDSVNTFFGGVRVNDWQHGILTGNASPFVREESGMLYLYSGSERGMIFKYAINADSLRNGTFSLIDSNYTRYNAGSRTTIEISDINGDGGNEYLIGNSRGGIMLLSDINWNKPTAIDNIYQNKNSIDVYPNPASANIFVKHISMLENTNFVVYDITGKKLLLGKLNAEKQISVEPLANGTYILQLTNSRFSASQRFVVYR